MAEAVAPDTPTPRKEGWLLKWTNYMKGFQRRYFVLDGGVLAYYRSPEELGHSCRGTLRITDASIESHMGNNFVVHAGGNAKSGQSFHLRTVSDEERSAWIGALNLAKQVAGNSRSYGSPSSKTGTLSARSAPSTPAAAITMSAAPDSDDAEEEFYSDEESEEIANSRIPDERELSRRTATVAAACDRVSKSNAELETRLATAANMELTASAGIDKEQVASVYQDSKTAADAATALSRAALKLSATAETHHLRWKRMLAASEAKRKQLEEALENVAKDHRRLEIDARRATRGQTTSAESAAEDEFFDALSEGEVDGYDPTEPSPAPASVQPAEELTVSRTSTGEDFVRRTSVPFKPDKRASLWSIMKNSIGKDLSRIAMPVNFNEPLSFTQRLSEDLEYSELLDEAVRCSDEFRRMALVSAFTMSAFASGAYRTGKPFNPLLGETFELERSKTKGYRAIVEQVSHHPPICAFHAESDAWIFWQEFSMDSKFRGKYLEIVPTGVSHLILKESGDHYTWKKVNTTIHNIIVGKLWMENHGEMTVRNHRTGVTCELDYKAYSIFSSNEARLVVGEIKDLTGQVKLKLKGTWDKYMSLWTPGNEANPSVIWERNAFLPNFEKMYGFTRMAIEANEITPTERGCAITDSRFRVDKSFMEQGDFEMADRTKVLLEEGQRHRRRQYEASMTRWTPAWFEIRDDPTHPGRKVHQYKGGYWEARAANDFASHNLTDIYDVSPVAAKDPQGAAAYQKLLPAEYPGKGATAES